MQWPPQEFPGLKGKKDKENSIFVEEASKRLRGCRSSPAPIDSQKKKTAPELRDQADVGGGGGPFRAA